MRYFASVSLLDALGGDRVRIERDLLAAIRGALDDLASGIDAVAVVVEALHPPPQAAAAYHRVQAAGITAAVKVATARSRAVTTLEAARSSALTERATAVATAADTVAAGRIDALLFQADDAGWRAGPDAFTLERYFARLRKASPAPACCWSTPGSARPRRLSSISAMCRRRWRKGWEAGGRTGSRRSEVRDVNRGPSAHACTSPPPSQRAGRRAPAGRRGGPRGVSRGRWLRFAAAGMVVAVLIAAACLVVVPAGEALVVMRLGDPVRVLTTPGLHAKLPIPLETTTTVDLRLRTTTSGFQDVGTRDGLRIFDTSLRRMAGRGQFRRCPALPPVGAERPGRGRPPTPNIPRLGAGSDVERSRSGRAGEHRPQTPRIRSSRKSVARAPRREGHQRLRHRRAPGRAGAADPAGGDARRHSVADERGAPDRRDRTGPPGTAQAAEISAGADRDSRQVGAKSREAAAAMEAEGRQQAAEIYANSYRTNPKLYTMLRSLDTLENVVGENTRLILRTDAPPFRVFVEGPEADAGGGDREKPRRVAPSGGETVSAPADPWSQAGRLGLSAAQIVVALLLVAWATANVRQVPPDRGARRAPLRRTGLRPESRPAASLARAGREGRLRTGGGAADRSPGRALPGRRRQWSAASEAADRRLMFLATTAASCSLATWAATWTRWSPTKSSSRSNTWSPRPTCCPPWNGCSRPAPPPCAPAGRSTSCWRSAAPAETRGPAEAGAGEPAPASPVPLTNGGGCELISSRPSTRD